MTHATEFADLQKRVECMWKASTEVISSMCLRELLRTVLRTANYINHGSSEGAKAFSVKSLPAFASFSVGSVSTLHYLCLTLCDPAFISRLQEDLAHVSRASRDTFAGQQQDITAFGQCAAYTQNQLRSFSPGDTGSEASVEEANSMEVAKLRLSALHETLQEQHRVLQQTLDRVRLHVEETQRFFGDPSTVLLPGEEFFGYIAGFVGLLISASAQVQQNPRHWQRFLSAADHLQGGDTKPRPRRSLSSPPESLQ